MKLSKTRHYERAIEYLESGDNAKLPSAALELRMCLESIVYEKLRTYQRHIPERIKRQWRPDQALRALVKLEPDADQSFRLFMGREEEPGVPSKEMKHVRTHYSVSAKWVRKNYNKLGSFVHEPQPFISPKYPWRIQQERNREAITQIADDMKDAAYSDLGAAMRPVLAFECENCDAHVVCNELALEEGGTVECLDPNCATEYRVAKAADDDWEFTIPTASFFCNLCKAKNSVEERSLDVGLVHECIECGEELVLKLAFVPKNTQEHATDGS